mgnify:CR=1 FL=1|tara:strand:+ start:911 stop:1093 length:183 start_codon:yes stop_codon:yes gene_type:complete
MDHHHLHTVTVGAIGTLAPLLGVITSLQQEIDFYLRITSLCLGIIVGLASLYSILKNLPK